MRSSGQDGPVTGRTGARPLSGPAAASTPGHGAGDSGWAQGWRGSPGQARRRSGVGTELVGAGALALLGTRKGCHRFRRAAYPDCAAGSRRAAAPPHTQRKARARPRSSHLIEPLVKARRCLRRQAVCLYPHSSITSPRRRDAVLGVSGSLACQGGQQILMAPSKWRACICRW